MENNTAQFIKMGMDNTMNDEELNHRFRGWITNKNGRHMFIEFSSTDVTYNMQESITKKYKLGTYYTRISHLFDAKDEETNYTKDLSKIERNKNFKTSAKNILKFLNNTLDCNYTEISLNEYYNTKNATKSFFYYVGYSRWLHGNDKELLQVFFKDHQGISTREREILKDLKYVNFEKEEQHILEFSIVEDPKLVTDSFSYDIRTNKIIG
jgi:hypothetical protein